MKPKRSRARQVGLSTLLAVVAALCMVCGHHEAGALLRALSGSIAGVASAAR